MKHQYVYNATITRVVDGDTVDATIDLGFKIFHKVRLRLYGIDAPEIYGVKKTTNQFKSGMIAKDWLTEQIEGKDVMVYTYKDKTGKYGRYLATIQLNDGTEINLKMVEEGFAEVYE